MNIIEVNNLSKKYSRSLKHSLKYGFQDSIKDIFGGLKESKDLRPHEFWAIENISFNLKKESLWDLLEATAQENNTIKSFKFISKANVWKFQTQWNGRCINCSWHWI